MEHPQQAVAEVAVSRYRGALQDLIENWRQKYNRVRVQCGRSQLRIGPRPTSDTPVSNEQRTVVSHR